MQELLEADTKEKRKLLRTERAVQFSLDSEPWSLKDVRELGDFYPRTRVEQSLQFS